MKFNGKKIVDIPPYVTVPLTPIRLNRTNRLVKWWLKNRQPYSWESEIEFERSPQDVLRKSWDKTVTENDDLWDDIDPKEKATIGLYAMLSLIHPALPYAQYDRLDPRHEDAAEPDLSDPEVKHHASCRDVFRFDISLAGRCWSSVIREFVRIVKICLSDHGPNRGKVLVFATYISVLDVAHEALTQSGIAVLRFDGSVSEEERSRIQTQLKDFSEMVILVTRQSGAYGCNWTAATKVIQLQLDYNPSNEDKALYRAYRIGQTKVVTHYRIVVADSIHQRVHELHAIKREKAEYFLTDLRIKDRATFDRQLAYSKRDFADLVCSPFPTFAAGVMLTLPSVGYHQLRCQN
jgi:Helicase conserved C-terminal domain